MSTFIPLVPHAKQSSASSNSFGAACEPAFNMPVRWTLRVLAWTAFGIASYLAWSAMTQSAVAGCTAGSHAGCDLVLSSSWSKWLGIPVAVLGLGCYAALATLSVFLGVRSAEANRWITTVFVMLAIAAASVSLWLIGVQIFALQTYCQWCLVTDSCGIALGTIATIFAVRSVYMQQAGASGVGVQPGLMALRTTMPVATSRTAPLAIRNERSSPWLLPAIGGAIPLIALLIGGQLLFASKTYDLEKVALKDSIQMVGANSDSTSGASSGGKERVAMRVPSEDENVRPSLPTDPANPNAKSDVAGKDTSDSGSEKSASEPAEPTKKRLVKFLGGKLTLDVYQHPVIGSPEAPHIAIEMISYDCPHCRKMYPIMEHALERYGDQVALLIMVQPLDKECNRLVTDEAMSHPGACATAMLAMGIAHVNPGSFASFHDFLMSTKDKPPGMEAALPKAHVLADRDRLRKLTQGDELTKQLEGYVDLFDTLQKRSGRKDFGLPVQILGDEVMNGSVEHEEDVFKAWEANLGVKPK
jgi:uncharacterized membrane protein